MNKMSTKCGNNNNTSYFASTRIIIIIKNTITQNNDGDPISFSQRHTIKTPTSVFPHTGFLLRVARVTEPMGYKACDRELQSERWRKTKAGEKVEREEMRALLGGQRLSEGRCMIEKGGAGCGGCCSSHKASLQQS